MAEHASKTSGSPPHKLVLLVTVVQKGKGTFFADFLQTFDVNLQICVVPRFDIPNDKPIKPTSVSKYAPYIKVLSYEAFEKVSTNVTLNSKDMDEKEIKSVLEKISLDAVEVFGEPVEINKFPEHCQI